MLRRTLRVAPKLALCGLLLLARPLAHPAAGEDPRRVEAPPFGLSKLWRVHVEVSAEEYKAMQPPPPAGLPGGPPQAPRVGRPGPKDAERNLFGVEFPWARGAVTLEGQTLKGADLRYSGNASYMASAGGLKRSFLVDLGRSEPPGAFGLRGLLLQAGSLDPSGSREALAFRLFRDAGVPAPRTALAEVTLSVEDTHEKAELGLYTVVEPVDRVFLKDRFQAEKGLLLRPQGMQGLDFLGDDWEKYRGPYRPLAEPSADEARRLIDFLRLIHRADDERFGKEIASYLDIDKFLRFMAVQSLIANADGFFTLAYNYALFLDPGTNRFVFLPGDQELSFANFAMMGSAEQLMAMSLVHPYAAPNRLADRLLALPEVREAQRKILVELASTVFRKDRLLADVAEIEAVARPVLEREAAARVARAEPPVGFGPPGGPTAPDLRTFAEKRSASIADQLAGKAEGYRPTFNFGPPGGNAPLKPMDDATIGAEIKGPPGFKVTLFAAPPKVNYPVTLSVAPDGAVFVAVDEQGSLGRTPGGGRIMRCLDVDGDGKADQITTFARADHARGVIALEGKVWVLHPPLLSVFRDEDGDGVSDRQETLVSGLTTSQIDERGGDHTTNGIRMGVDGWIYIAVGDYGFHGARGKDGTTLSQRGGGILRVRPDGNELEVFATGLRNPFAIAIDPFLNLFTRDNTNDGAGWDVRVSQLFATAEYGYTRTFTNFPGETMPALGSYGQGGGTGAIAIDHARWPEGLRGGLLTADWGRSEMYRHDLVPSGASFLASQEPFASLPRPTGMDLGPDGRLYVASWRGGEASTYVGPDVGFVACLSPPGLEVAKVRDPRDRTLPQLIPALSAGDTATRLGAQREILRRGPSPETSGSLIAVASDPQASLAGRVAALFALKQLDGANAHATLRKLARDASLREFAVRALADRKGQIDGADASLFVEALSDVTPRVRAQALIALGRSGDVANAARIVPLTSRPAGSPMPTARPVHFQPDPDRVVPHLAVRALVGLQAVEACLEALDGPHQEGALQALRLMHEPAAVEGLIRKLASAHSAETRLEILAALARLQQREAEYDGSWWGIRPDTTGPYFDPRDWECSARIAAVLEAALGESDARTAALLTGVFQKNGARIAGLAAGPRPGLGADEEIRVVIAAPDPKNPDQIGNMTFESASRRALAAKGDAERGRGLFAKQSCTACHTHADGQRPRGPHLVAIGQRYRPEELVESILKPSAKIAQGYESCIFGLTDGRVVSGFVVSEGASVVQIRDLSGALHELKRADIGERKRQEASVMPEAIAGNLTPEQLADLIAYLRSL